MAMKSLTGARPRLPGRLKATQQLVDPVIARQSPASDLQCTQNDSIRFLATFDTTETSRTGSGMGNESLDCNSHGAVESPGHGPDLDRVMRAADILTHSHAFRRCVALTSLYKSDEPIVSDDDCSDDSFEDTAWCNLGGGKKTLATTSGDIGELRAFGYRVSVSDQDKGSVVAESSGGQADCYGDVSGETLTCPCEERQLSGSTLEINNKVLPLNCTELHEDDQIKALQTSLQALHLTDADIDTICQGICLDFTQDSISAAAAAEMQKEMQDIDIDSLPPLSAVPFNWCIKPSYEKSYSNPFMTAYYDRHYGATEDAVAEGHGLSVSGNASDGTRSKKATHKPRRPNTEHQGGQGNRISTTPAPSLADRVQRLRVQHK